MTRAPKRRQVRPEPADSATPPQSVQPHRQHITRFILAAALALALQAALYVPEAPIVIGLWGFACAAALAALYLIHHPLTGGSQTRKPAQPGGTVELSAFASFGTAWASGILIVGTQLNPVSLSLYGLGLVIIAGALSFLAGGGLLQRSLIILPAAAFTATAEGSLHGFGTGLIACLGTAGFALAATSTGARLRPRVPETNF